MNTPRFLPRLLCLALLPIAFAAHGRDAPIVGPVGSGGQSFRSECPEGEFVVGINGTRGKWIDGIQLVCARPDHEGVFHSRHGLGAIASFNGAASTYVGCSTVAQGAQPPEGAMKSLNYGLTRLNDGQNGFVDDIYFFCNQISGHWSMTDWVSLTSAGADSIACHYAVDMAGPYRQECRSRNADASSDCFPNERVTGVYGRAGRFIDALGLVCSPVPDLTPKYSALGRAKVTPPNYGSTSTAPDNGAANRGVVARHTPVVTSRAGIASGASANGESLPSLNRPVPKTTQDRSARGGLAGFPTDGQQGFAPATFDDGARLWACDGAADQTCDGSSAARAWCAAHGFGRLASNAPPTLLEREGNEVRSAGGEKCQQATCAIVDSVTCAQ